MSASHTIAPTSGSAVLVSARSPSLLCSLEKLAQVEVQSIFQFLTDHSLFLLARCSSSLYRDAHSPVVWRHRLVSMDLRKSQVLEDESNFERKINSAASWSYTRKAEARFHLVVDLNDFKHEPSFLSVVDQLLRVPFISSLVIGGAEYFDWNRFFAAGSVGRHLHSLSMSGDNYLNTAFIPLLVDSAPNLTSISFGEATKPVREIEVLYSSLAGLKSLKSLRLVESPHCSFLPLMTACRSLTSLTLAHTDVKLSLPQMLRQTLAESHQSAQSQIEELAIEKLHALTSPFHDEQLQDDLVAIFQQLPLLKRLRFTTPVTMHKIAVIVQAVFPTALSSNQPPESPRGLNSTKTNRSSDSVASTSVPQASSPPRIFEVLVTENRNYESEEEDELQEAVRNSAQTPAENQFHVLVKTYRPNIAAYFDALGPRFTTQILQRFQRSTE